MNQYSNAFAFRKEIFKIFVGENNSKGKRHCLRTNQAE